MQLQEIEDYDNCHDEEEIYDEEGEGGACDQIEREEYENREDEELKLFNLASQFQHGWIILSNSGWLLGNIIKIQSTILSLRSLHLLITLTLFVLLAICSVGIDQFLDELDDDDEQEEEDREEAEEDGAALAVLGLGVRHFLNLLYGR